MGFPDPKPTVDTVGYYPSRLRRWLRQFAKPLTRAGQCDTLSDSRNFEGLKGLIRAGSPVEPEPVEMLANALLETLRTCDVVESLDRVPA